MSTPVRVPALIERHVWPEGACFPTLEYLRFDDPENSTEEPWTRARKEAHVFPCYEAADKLARRLSTPEMHVFPVVASTPSQVAATYPARHSTAREREARHHDWREDVPNAGVL